MLCICVKCHVLWFVKCIFEFSINFSIFVQCRCSFVMFVVTLYGSQSQDSLDWEVHSSSASTSSSSRRAVRSSTCLAEHLLYVQAAGALFAGEGNWGQLSPPSTQAKTNMQCKTTHAHASPHPCKTFSTPRDVQAACLHLLNCCFYDFFAGSICSWYRSGTKNGNKFNE